MLKTLLAAAALAVGLGAVGGNLDGNLVDVHYRGGIRHFHSGAPVYNKRPVYRDRRVYRDYGYRDYGYRSRPRVGLGLQLNLGPTYRVVPQSRGYVASYSARHHAWCEGKYRSYRRHDGTFQPYHGHRRRCNSPYDGI